MVVGQMTALSACFFHFLLLLLIKSCPKSEAFLRPYSTDTEIVSSFGKSFFSLEPKLPPVGACWEEGSQRPSTGSMLEQHLCCLTAHRRFLHVPWLKS